MAYLIDVPEKITITGRDKDGQPFEDVMRFQDFVIMSIDNNPKTRKGAEMAELANGLEFAVSHLNGQDKLRLPDDQYELMDISTQGMGWLPGVNRQLWLFHKAIKEAKFLNKDKTKENPAPKEKEAA